MIGALVERGRKRLAEAPFEVSRREAYLLLGHVLDLTEAQILARWEDDVNTEAEEAFRDLLDRRLRGEPVAYLLGRREFYGRTFRVDSRVLIPRPETEHLIETALALPLGARPRILDLGTGSGCIAITLALELAGSSVTAVDASVAALVLAARNAQDLGASSVRPMAADLAGSTALDDFDLVVSNPPYVGREEAAAMSIEVRGFEPHQALFPSGDADSLIRRLATELAGLPSGAFLLFEIGHLQSRRAEKILDASAFVLERIVDDYQGIPRVVVARRE
ncbi:MAG: peptide chain release factor N(5)-glutamine methyltransferase [bacterium]|nr:peptide chain release factor N(5)-glutamine methyltransferase [bacterium]